MKNNKGDRGDQGDRGDRGTRAKAGYKYLLAYKITVPVYDYVVVFSGRCKSPDLPDYPDLSSPRSHDQIIQAARSSMKGYIYLAGISRGSLDELLKDLSAYARQNRISVWSRERCIGEIREIWGVIRKTPVLPAYPDFPHLPDDPEVALNLLITLVHQAGYLVDKLIASLHKKHKTEGGLTERLYRERREYRGY